MFATTKMPKGKQPDAIRIRNLIVEFGSDILGVDGDVLKCKLCNVKLNCNRRSNIIAHFQTSKHSRKVESLNQDGDDVNCDNPQQEFQFNLDLCHTLVNANIPIWKLENKYFKDFLEKYTAYSVPHESTVRKNYVDKHYNVTMQNIREIIGNNKIWLSVDETTDATGRHIANAIVGTLEIDKKSRVFILHSKQLDKTNSTTIAQFIAVSLSLLWPDGIRFDNVILLVTDAAAYMKKCALSLQIMYPNMIHLTCLAHGLHRVAEEVRAQFPDVDRLISNGKKIF